MIIGFVLPLDRNPHEISFSRGGTDACLSWTRTRWEVLHRSWKDIISTLITNNTFPLIALYSNNNTRVLGRLVNLKLTYVCDFEINGVLVSD